jgi:hypothetical protein
LNLIDIFNFFLHSDTVAVDGAYNLRLKSVLFARDNGRFFCSVNDLETGRQMVSQPASVVVLGIFMPFLTQF